MKSCSFVLPALFLAASVAATTSSLQAAAVSVPVLQTGGQPSANGAEIHSSAGHTVDLSDRSGLTPGQNILVTLVASEAPVFLSSFQPAGGPFSYTVTETLSLIIGGQSFDSKVVISFFAPDVPAAGADPGTSHIVGYHAGPLFDPVAVSVPWDTDLSAITVRLSQDGAISGGFFVGGNATQVDGLVVGGTRLNTLSLRLTSIPEPGAALSVVLAGMGLALRRRRCAGAA